MDIIGRQNLKFRYLTSEELWKAYKSDELLVNLLSQVYKFAIAHELEPPRWTDNEYVALVAYCDNKPVGITQYYAFDIAKNKAECYVSWIYVLEQYRGHGIAKAMIEDLQAFIQSLDTYVSITSYVLKDNLPSNELHKSLGFIQKDPQAFAVSDTGESSNRFTGYTWEVAR